MKQHMIFGFVKVNNLSITGCQFGPGPFSKSMVSYLPQRTQLVVATINVKNHYQFTTHSTGSPEVHHLCFIPMWQYLLMLISHMSEDDETHF